MTVITGAHERLQPVEAGAGEHWRDEVELHAWDPASGLFLVARLAVLPNRPAATAGVLAWVGGRPAYVYGHALDDVPLADWDDVTIAAVRLRELDPLTTWGLDLDDGDNGVSLRWNGRSAALPTGDRKYEQSSHVVGRVVLNGHPIAVDGVGHRVHVWGDPTTAAPDDRYVGFLGPADAARPDQRAFTIRFDENGTASGFVHEAGADDVVTRGDADGGAVHVETEGGRRLTITGAPHGDAVPVAAAPDGSVRQLQLMRYSADDGLEGYGLAERS